MLQITKGAHSSPPDNETLARGTSLIESLNSLLGIIHRQLPIFLVIITCTTVLGLLYLFTTPSTYTATATMVIDTHKVQLFQQQSMIGDVAVDAGTVQTQVEILKSQNIGLSVIKDLHLTDDPEFVRPKSGLLGAVLGTVTGLFGGASDARSEAQLQRRALENFDGNRTVTRVGLTYVLDVNFRSLDPAKAARIANAIVDAYVLDQLGSKYEATRRASIWLQNRIKELRTQATAAQRAVVAFKQQHNIIDAGGRLMNEQELAEVNSQLIVAHASTAEAKARLDNINQVLKQPIPDAAVADALNSQVVIGLRNKYLELAGRESLWSQKYGPNHLAVVNLRNQMLELRKSISDEMKKIAETYQNNYDVALARENAIKSKLDSTVTQTQNTDQAQVQLRELESNAQTYQALYDNFLQRYMEAIQQESFPISEARLISPALPPSSRSAPKAAIVLPLTAIAGMMIGFGVAFFREMADRVFRTGAQVETRLQVNCLAMLPALNGAGAGALPKSWSARLASLFEPVTLDGSAAGGSDHRRKKSKTPRLPVTPAAAANQSSALSLFPKHHAEEGKDAQTGNEMLWQVIHAPFSQFTEALRSVKVAIDLNGTVQSNRIIGITSSIPNEGKSTIAANLAALIADAGARAILIDADLRNPSLSRSLAPNAPLGLVDVLARRVDLDAALCHRSESKLAFLPVGNASKLMHTNDILASESAKKFFTSLRDSYDYVIVDFAPLAPVVDTRVTSSFIDSYIYVIEWGRTKVDIVEHSLATSREIYDRLLGVVLNKADMNTLRRYEHYRSNYYYNKYYSRYGYTA